MTLVPAIDIEVTPAEIRAAWTEIQAGRNPLKRPHTGLTDMYGSWRSTREDPWIGCSGKQMNDWLTFGYWPEGESLPVSPAAAETRMPYPVMDEEEGDLIISDAIGGEDMFYCRWENMVARRGLDIHLCVDFNAGTRATVISEYVDWLLNLVDSILRTGVSPSVTLYQFARGTFQDAPQRYEKIRCPVMRSGESFDPMAWRAFLTRGGFRTLSFLALGIAGDKLGKTVRQSLGMAAGGGWNIIREGDVLDVRCDSNANAFPREHMNELLQKVGI